MPAGNMNVPVRDRLGSETELLQWGTIHGYG